MKPVDCHFSYWNNIDSHEKNETKIILSTGSRMNRFMVVTEKVGGEYNKRRD